MDPGKTKTRARMHPGCDDLEMPDLVLASCLSHTGLRSWGAAAPQSPRLILGVGLHQDEYDWRVGTISHVRECRLRARWHD